VFDAGFDKRAGFKMSRFAGRGYASKYMEICH
jgi:hypothetical protein